MLAHDIKAILTIIPEALEMVKKANLEEEFPVDSKDSTVASYLRTHYLTKVAGKLISEDDYLRVKKAAYLWGVEEELEEFLPRFTSIALEKVAQSNSSKYGLTVSQVEAGFEGDLAGFGFLNLEKIASQAEDIMSTYGDEVTSEDVRRYSGRTWLDKYAAVTTLGNRYHATKDQTFVKLAQLVVNDIKENDFDSIHDLCKTVAQLDKRAGLDIIGFNFYKEALLTKEAAFLGSLSVTLAGEPVPYEKIMRFGKDRISSTLGPDIGNSMTQDPVENKAMLESLPRDLQITLKSLLKSS
jgi:hypothetical protein